MTTNHIDQLAQWYEEAERITKTNLPNDGDSIIYPRFNGGGYTIETNTEGWTADIVRKDEPVRILARAPKPTPAWTKAAAVTADLDDRETRRLLVNCGGGEWRDCLEGRYLDWNELRNANPLGEARVTDEMVERLERHFLDTAKMALPDGLARRILTAALGLDPKRDA